MVLIFQKTFIIIILVTCASQVLSRSLYESTTIVEKHEKWMAQHGRSYQDDTEKEMRLKIFEQNLEYIEKANMQGNRTYKLGTNAFSDLTIDEFRALYTGYKMPSPSRRSTALDFKYANVTEVPSSMDWREKGAVTHIKDQGQCGCCWAFSAVAAMEGIIQISNGQLNPLSEQQLLDCSTNGNNNGCNGGWMDDAFEYIIQNQGLATETDYPYQQVQGTCDTQEAIAAAKISKYENVPSNDEQALLQAATKQPVSVCIEGGGQDFKHYQGGIFNGECETQCNHAVAIVGFGTEDGTKYWLIKNSWGQSWGEAGYMRILRDVEASEGLCGIATGSSYPVA